MQHVLVRCPQRVLWQGSTQKALEIRQNRWLPWALAVRAMSFQIVTEDQPKVQVLWRWTRNDEATRRQVLGPLHLRQLLPWDLSIGRDWVSLLLFKDTRLKWLIRCDGKKKVSLEAHRYNRTCYICNHQKKDVPCMQCDYAGCSRYYHVRCAYEREILKNSCCLASKALIDPGNQFNYAILCEEHEQLSLQKIRVGLFEFSWDIDQSHFEKHDFYEDEEVIPSKKKRKAPSKKDKPDRDEVEEIKLDENLYQSQTTLQEDSPLDLI
jgi:hypothetical protein